MVQVFVTTHWLESQEYTCSVKPSLEGYTAKSDHLPCEYRLLCGWSRKVDRSHSWLLALSTNNARPPSNATRHFDYRLLIRNHRSQAQSESSYCTAVALFQFPLGFSRFFTYLIHTVASRANGHVFPAKVAWAANEKAKRWLVLAHDRKIVWIWIEPIIICWLYMKYIEILWTHYLYIFIHYSYYLIMNLHKSQHPPAMCSPWCQGLPTPCLRAADHRGETHHRVDQENLKRLGDSGESLQ